MTVTAMPAATQKGEATASEPEETLSHSTTTVPLKSAACSGRRTRTRVR